MLKNADTMSRQLTVIGRFAVVGSALLVTDIVSYLEMIAVNATVKSRMISLLTVPVNVGWVTVTPAVSPVTVPTNDTFAAFLMSQGYEKIADPFFAAWSGV
jgi:hypothetical protein